MQLTTDRGNKDRRLELQRRTGLCGYCKPHRGCNRNWHGRPRPDKYKRPWRDR